MCDENITDEINYDVSIIRPRMRSEDFKIRGRDMKIEKLNAVKKGLHTLHTLELMAMTIYRFQINKKNNSEFNRQLIAAMCNEMTHYQDFQIKLYEYGFRPRLTRIVYWFVGFGFGFGSRLLGRRAILKTAVWVEAKAVRHYTELLDTIDWDPDTKKVVEKNQADENGHINRWRKLLESGIN